MEYETRSRDLQGIGWLGGIVLGALAMYFADPSHGRRRRALLRDQVNSASHKTSKLVGQTLRDARNRFTGLQAEALRLFSPLEAKPIDDHVLEARVRSRLGRAMPHSHQIQVSAHQGVVTLMGDFDPDELPRLLELVEAIPGVEKVWHQAYTNLIRTNRVSRLLSGRSVLWMATVAGVGWAAWYALGSKVSSDVTSSRDASDPEHADRIKAKQVQPSAGNNLHETEQVGKSSLRGSVLH